MPFPGAPLSGRAGKLPGITRPAPEGAACDLPIDTLDHTRGSGRDLSGRARHPPGPTLETLPHALKEAIGRQAASKGTQASAKSKSLDPHIDPGCAQLNGQPDGQGRASTGCDRERAGPGRCRDDFSARAELGAVRVGGVKAVQPEQAGACEGEHQEGTGRSAS